MHGESTRRRSIRVRLADLPGSLNELTRLLADKGVNIDRLEVVSHHGPDVWDDIEMSADSDDKLDAVVRALRERGLPVVGLPPGWAIRDWATGVLSWLEAIGAASSEAHRVRVFTEAAADLANVANAFVLTGPSSADAAAAEARWEKIVAASRHFDPELVEWSSQAVGRRLVSSAMQAARAELDDPGHIDGAVGAVVQIPNTTGRPAYLVVLGVRPVFLAPELARIDMFAQVAAPHLWAVAEALV